MRALVVYESMFGGTELIARAVGEGLAMQGSVDVVNVDAAPTAIENVDLLVVGGPTHAHGMSRPSTRQGAAQQATGGIRSGNGIREWLDALVASRPGMQAAVFDTRLAKPRWLTGSAAKAAAKRLRRHGYPLLAQPESFLVGSESAELLPGEQERARSWAHTLGTTVAAKA
jgi:flavodoxin-like protein